jgi:Lysyl oxidase
MRSLIRMLVSLATATTLLVVAAGPGLSNSARPSKLKPDLVTLPPYGFSIDVVGAQRILRFANEVGNADVGPLELFPVVGDCDGNGDPEDDRVAYQRLYVDGNGNGIFERGADTRSRSRVAGCFAYHPEHNHWHFETFARYQLRRMSDDKMVRTSDKISFCVIDTAHPFPDVPGSPSSSFYRACDRDATTGLSVGWSDIYGPLLEGQSLDITTLADGDYCYISTSDPANLLVESDDSNNSVTTLLEIAGTEVTNTEVPC